MENKQLCYYAYVVFNPERLKIIEILKKGRKNISELHREMDLDRATVNYHLQLMKKEDILSAQYDHSEHKGRLAKYYSFEKAGYNKILRKIELFCQMG